MRSMAESAARLLRELGVPRAGTHSAATDAAGVEHLDGVQLQQDVAFAHSTIVRWLGLREGTDWRQVCTVPEAWREYACAVGHQPSQHALRVVHSMAAAAEDWLALLETPLRAASRVGAPERQRHVSELRRTLGACASTLASLPAGMLLMSHWALPHGEAACPGLVESPRKRRRVHVSAAAPTAPPTCAALVATSADASIQLSCEAADVGAFVEGEAPPDLQLSVARVRSADPPVSTALLVHVLGEPAGLLVSGGPAGGRGLWAGAVTLGAKEGAREMVCVDFFARGLAVARTTAAPVQGGHLAVRLLASPEEVVLETRVMVAVVTR